MMHRHHIIPRHAGGTDDPSNLFLLSPLQHALAHRNRAILLHSSKDWIAWKMLSGQMGKEEARQQAWFEGYKNRDTSYLTSPEYVEHQRKTAIEKNYTPPPFTGKTHSQEARASISEAMLNNKRAQGKRWKWTEEQRKAHSLRMMGNKNKRKVS